MRGKIRSASMHLSIHLHHSLSASFNTASSKKVLSMCAVSPRLLVWCNWPLGILELWSCRKAPIMVMRAYEPMPPVYTCEAQTYAEVHLLFFLTTWHDEKHAQRHTTLDSASSSHRALVQCNKRSARNRTPHVLIQWKTFAANYIIPVFCASVTLHKS